MPETIEQLEKELIELHEQIRTLNGKLVVSQPTTTKPGKLDTTLNDKRRNLEDREWELIKKLVKKYNPNSLL